MKDLTNEQIYDLISSTDDEVSFENIVILFEAFKDMVENGEFKINN